MNVELIRQNADGSADYMFHLSPESVAAFARLGIMTALQAAVDGAKRYEPDVDASDTLQERVDETAKNEPEFECPRCGHCCREWVGLSDEDIWQLRREGAHEVSDKHFKAIEAKLKEKNT